MTSEGTTVTIELGRRRRRVISALAMMLMVMLLVVSGALCALPLPFVSRICWSIIALACAAGAIHFARRLVSPAFAVLEVSERGLRLLRARGAASMTWSAIGDFRATFSGDLRLSSLDNTQRWRLPAQGGPVATFIFEVCKRAPQLRVQEPFVERRGRARLTLNLLIAIAMIDLGAWQLWHSPSPRMKLGSLAIWVAALLLTLVQLERSPVEVRLENGELFGRVGRKVRSWPLATVHDVGLTRARGRFLIILDIGHEPVRVVVKPKVVFRLLATLFAIVPSPEYVSGALPPDQPEQNRRQ